MKVLYVETNLRGHRINYLKTLSENAINAVALVPEFCSEICCEQIVYKRTKFCSKHNFYNYLSWIKEIRKVSRDVKADIIHFLCGDSLYRFFGIGLNLLNAKIVVTYHHMLFNFLRTLSIKRIYSQISFGVVHTEYLYRELLNKSISNSGKIEYPCFCDSVLFDSKIAKDKMGIPNDRKCLMILGGTQKYKGLDILLDALKNVTAPFCLCITGVIRDFDEKYIIENIESYKDNVILHLERLSDEEYITALAATDIMVLPYRNGFDGASGPMIDAVWNRKYIVGANHGSMGNIISKYELGVTFLSESVNDLTRVLNETLNKDIIWGDKAELFRKELEPKQFIASYMQVYNNVLKKNSDKCNSSYKV